MQRSYLCRGPDCKVICGFSTVRVVSAPDLGFKGQLYHSWQPSPASQLAGTLVGCSPWGREESDTTDDLTFTFHFHALEKEMATQASVLAWRIPGTGEPGGPPSMGSHRVRHD